MDSLSTQGVNKGDGTKGTEVIKRPNPMGCRGSASRHAR